MKKILLLAAVLLIQGCQEIATPSIENTITTSLGESAAIIIPSKANTQTFTIFI